MDHQNINVNIICWYLIQEVSENIYLRLKVLLFYFVKENGYSDEIRWETMLNLNDFLFLTCELIG